MTGRHDTHEQPTPTCPHCGYALTTDDMLNNKTREDLFALAPHERETTVECLSCGKKYSVQGGYTPHYTSAIFEDDLT